MNSTDVNYDDGRKPLRNIIISIVLIFTAVCCCAIIGVAGYYGYQTYVKVNETVEQIQDLIPPTVMPPNSNGTPGIPGYDLSAVEVPEGGLADPETKYLAWTSLALMALVEDCGTTSPGDTVITVLQEPSSPNGPWVEEWKVACQNGESIPFRITFIPESDGTTSLDITTPSAP